MDRHQSLRKWVAAFLIALALLNAIRTVGFVHSSWSWSELHDSAFQFLLLIHVVTTASLLALAWLFTHPSRGRWLIAVALLAFGVLQSTGSAALYASAWASHRAILSSSEPAPGETLEPFRGFRDFPVTEADVRRDACRTVLHAVLSVVGCVTIVWTIRSRAQWDTE